MIRPNIEKFSDDDYEDVFDRLHDHGLKPIALQSGRKSPLAKGWSKDYNFSRQKVLATSRRGNIGILLGDVVDVEGDDDYCNEKIDRLTAGVPHPIYQSNKSRHHLFQNPKGLVRHLFYGNIEIRGHGHQSVVPPSKIDDIRYSWVNFDAPIPPMPQPLLSFCFFLLSFKPRKKFKYFVFPRCLICNQVLHVHRRLFQFEMLVFDELNQPWSCIHCREDRQKISGIVRVLKKRYRKVKNFSWRDYRRRACSGIPAKT